MGTLSVCSSIWNLAIRKLWDGVQKAGCPLYRYICPSRRQQTVHNRRQSEKQQPSSTMQARTHAASCSSKAGIEPSVHHEFCVAAGAELVHGRRREMMMLTCNAGKQLVKWPLGPRENSPTVGKGSLVPTEFSTFAQDRASQPTRRASRHLPLWLEARK